MSLVSTADPNVKRRRSSFARAAAADAFGGRYFGWREWGEFEDEHADDIEERGYSAIWSNRSQ